MKINYFQHFNLFWLLLLWFAGLSTYCYMQLKKKRDLLLLTWTSIKMKFKLANVFISFILPNLKAIRPLLFIIK